MSQQPTRKRKRSNVPIRSDTQRHQQLAEAIIESGVRAMVACTHCVEEDLECYYDRDQSIKCAECVRRQRKCDGTFALQEFRKVGEQKKEISEKSRKKRREISKLRAALAALEDEDNDLQEELAKLDEISSRMLRREMRALGALDHLNEEQEVAVAVDHFSDWPPIPPTEPVDWDEMLILQESLGPVH